MGAEVDSNVNSAGCRAADLSEGVKGAIQKALDAVMRYVTRDGDLDTEDEALAVLADLWRAAQAEEREQAFMPLQKRALAAEARSEKLAEALRYALPSIAVPKAYTRAVEALDAYTAALSEPPQEGQASSPEHGEVKRG